MNNSLNQIKECKNCNNNYKGNFCNLCGQASHTHKINFHYIINEIQHSIFNVDDGILYTIKELFLRPGNSIREFIEGKRVKHFKPITFVMVLSIIHYLLEHYRKKTPLIEDFLLGTLKGIKSPLLEWLIQDYSYTVLLLIPFFSFASYLSFIKSKLNYFEHIILNTYIFGQITLIFIFTFLITFFISQNYFFDYFNILSVIVFTFWTYYQFFNNLKKYSRIINTLITYILFMLFISFTLIAIILYQIISTK